MPQAFAQAGYSRAAMPTTPKKEGTIVPCTTRAQKYYARVYETPRAAEDMLDAEGAFNVLSDLGTIHGEEIRQPTNAGGLPIKKEDVQLLAAVWARWSAMTYVSNNLVRRRT